MAETSPYLWGVVNIAAYVGLSRRATYHLIQQHGLPVRRHGRRMFALKSEIDDYLLRRDHAA